MMKRWQTAVTILLLLALAGCGGLRYSKVAPEAKDFHPKRIAVLPADTRTFGESKGDIDRLFAEVLSQKKWFDVVVGGEAVTGRMVADASFRQVVTDYQAKLANVSFSDPDLSARIGEMTGTEAFFIVRVDYWNYTTLDDKKVAKVSLTVTLIEAKTGNTIWTAGHSRISDYVIIKPDLPDVARDLINEMIGHMPR
jgi:hypothetical protein